MAKRTSGDTMMLNDQQNDTLVELLMLKKFELENELKTIMGKRIPIWREMDHHDMDQEAMIDKIDEMLKMMQNYTT